MKLAKGYYKEADKIIRTKNYYHDEELLLSNGSIGLIQTNDGEALYFQEKDCVTKCSEGYYINKPICERNNLQ